MNYYDEMHDAPGSETVTRPHYLPYETWLKAMPPELMARKRAEAAGYPMILTVYDELVCEAKNGFGSKEELAALGANASLVHVDWMIGSGELDVDGILSDGKSEALMRKGEWAI